MSPTELLLVWRLFLVDAARNRKRIGLTVMAIAWGTLSIVLLLSFGEGMKRSFHRTSRGMGEGIGVLWPGATTRAYAGLPSGRPIMFTDEDAELLAARIPEITAISREYSKRVPVARGKFVSPGAARVRAADIVSLPSTLRTTSRYFCSTFTAKIRKPTCRRANATN